MFRICDQLADMEDRLRHVLSVRTLIEMTLIRASRIATTATVEELMKAVRALKSEGNNVELPDLGVQRDQRIAPPPPAVRDPALGAVDAPREPEPSPSQAREVAEVAAPERPSKPVSEARRNEILNDDKINAVLTSVPGAMITDIKGR